VHIAISRGLARYLSETEGFREESFEIVHYGITPNGEPEPYTDTVPRLLCVGRLIPIKGHICPHPGLRGREARGARADAGRGRPRSARAPRCVRWSGSSGSPESHDPIGEAHDRGRADAEPGGELVDRRERNELRILDDRLGDALLRVRELVVPPAEVRDHVLVGRAGDDRLGLDAHVGILSEPWWL